MIQVCCYGSLVLLGLFGAALAAGRWAENRSPKRGRPHHAPPS